MDYINILKVFVSSYKEIQVASRDKQQEINIVLQRTPRGPIQLPDPRLDIFIFHQKTILTVLLSDKTERQKNYVKFIIRVLSKLIKKYRLIGNTQYCGIYFSRLFAPAFFGDYDDDNRDEFAYLLEMILLPLDC